MYESMREREHWFTTQENVKDAHTDSVLDAQAVELRLREPTPNLRLVDLRRVLQPTVDRHNVLNEHIDSIDMLLMLLVNRERLLVQPVVDGDLRDLLDVVVVQLIDIPDDLALIRANSREHKQVL